MIKKILIFGGLALAGYVAGIAVAFATSKQKYTSIDWQGKDEPNSLNSVKYNFDGTLKDPVVN